MARVTIVAGLVLVAMALVANAEVAALGLDPDVNRDICGIVSSKGIHSSSYYCFYSTV